MDAYVDVEAGEMYCEDCAPRGAEPYADGGGEADAPKHCAECGVPLENPLTSDGVDYVLDAIRDSMAQSPRERNRIMPMRGTAEEAMTYYHGSRHVEIVRDWAKEIENYNLSHKEAALVRRFLSMTDK